MLRCFLVLTLLCSAAYAVDVQPSAKPYEPIVISHEEGATIQILPWRGEVPRYLEDEYVKKVGDLNTVFAAPPGAYLVFGGGSMAIVIIEGEVPDPKPDPPEEPDPKDPEEPGAPIPTLVLEASRNGARALNDRPTTTALINSLTSAINQTRGSPVEVQRAAVQSAIETVLLNRKGESAKKNWLELWRRTVNDAIESSDPERNYEKLVDQIIEGLKQSESQTSSKNVWVNKITYYTLPDCPDCEIWEENELEKLERVGWTVEKKIAPPGSGVVPWFEVCTYGKCYTHSGYLSGFELSNIIETMRP